LVAQYVFASLFRISTNDFSPHPRPQLCRVWQIHGFSTTQIPGKGPLGPAIFRARLVIAPPLFVFVFHASPQWLYWAMRAHRRCKMQGLGPGNGENNLDVWNVWNVRILSVGTRIHFPKFGQLLTKRRTLLFLRMCCLEQFNWIPKSAHLSAPSP
jgi:hypothetical protein